jgi:UDP-glucose 4-epimerase
VKRVLITGPNSYLSSNLAKYMEKKPEKYIVDLISVKEDKWKHCNFSNYDIIIHAAGLVHQKEKPGDERAYFKINKELTLDIADKAIISNVQKFIFISSMAVYGLEGELSKNILINHKTPPNPKTFYAKSKYEAELELTKLVNKSFKLLIVRPPMIYGPNCPGNYQKLIKLAKYLRVIPDLRNKRSALHIDRLCVLMDSYLENEVYGVVLPQDSVYMDTTKVILDYRSSMNQKTYLSKTLGLIIKTILRNLVQVRKIYGNLTYEK